MAPKTERNEEKPAQFKRFDYSEIIVRDKANLDIQWEEDAVGSRDDETPQSLMKDILGDLEEAMKEFSMAEAEIRR